MNSPEATFAGVAFNLKEQMLIEDFQLRTDQLRNIRKVMRNCTPKKLQKMETEVLPGYIIRERNAREKAERMMKKKGFRLRG